MELTAHRHASIDCSAPLFSVLPIIGEQREAVGAAVHLVIEDEFVEWDTVLIGSDMLCVRPIAAIALGLKVYDAHIHAPYKIAPARTEAVFALE